MCRTMVIDSIIQGILTGFGTAIGTYFAMKYGIDHLEKTPAKVKERVKDLIENPPKGEKD